MTRISAATAVSSLSGTDEFPVYDGTATAKKADIDDIGQYADDRLRVGVKVSNTSAQDIASTSTWTELSWDTIQFEEGGNLWDSTDSAKLVAPVAGVYAIHAQVDWTASATSGSTVQMRVKIGGTVYESSSDVFLNSATIKGVHQMQSLATLAAADEVTLEVWQDVAAGHDVASARTFFSLVMLARG